MRRVTPTDHDGRPMERGYVRGRYYHTRKPEHAARFPGDPELGPADLAGTAYLLGCAGADPRFAPAVQARARVDAARHAALEGPMPTTRDGGRDIDPADRRATDPAVAAERKDLCEAALARLTPRQRLAVVVIARCNGSRVDAARALGTSKDIVDGLVSVARARVRALIAGA